MMLISRRGLWKLLGGVGTALATVPIPLKGGNAYTKMESKTNVLQSGVRVHTVNTTDADALRFMLQHNERELNRTRTANRVAYEFLEDRGLSDELDDWRWREIQK